jgi:NADH-quinone oxidoreductase subunit M
VQYFTLLIITEVLLINVFTVLDFFYFYIFFESILIPMFIIIGVWGSQQRKIQAAIQFFLYTLISSLLVLALIIKLYKFSNGSSSYFFLISEGTQILTEKFWWILLFVPFAVKLPVWPVHLWLPEAHSEAPTGGSVLLAGILLKMAGYGILRFMLELFPTHNVSFTPFLSTIAVVSVIFGSITAIIQADFKKLIAYSSIAHMNYALLGIFAQNIIALQGAFFVMLSHGLVSSGLFIAVGFIYDRYKTRTIAYFSGLSQLYPKLAVCFLVFVLANMAIPTTSSFVAETLIMIGTVAENFYSILIATIAVVLTAPYSLWLYSRLFFGNFIPSRILQYSDLKDHELFVALILVFLILSLGLHPSIILDSTEFTLSRFLNDGLSSPL